MPGMIELRDVVVKLRYFTLGPISTIFTHKTYNVILGPTGSGKSTLLKAIAGIYRVSGGSIVIDGVDVTREPPETRNVSYVPQGYAVFDHMTVYENIEYGLRFRGVPKRERYGLVRRIAEDLGIDYLLNRKAVNLSGGEQQRVALARALVVRPKVLLLDEPLSMIDRETKDRIIPMLRGLPNKYGITVIHVTHDWDEAYSLADRIYIINNGRIVEEGDPEQVFNKPSRVFTAKFLGFQNVLKGVARGDAVILNGGVKLRINGNADGEVYVCIRPEWIKVVTNEGVGMDCQNVLRGVVNEVVRSRVGYQLLISIGNNLVLTALTATVLKPGDEVTLLIPRENIHIIRAGDYD